MVLPQKFEISVSWFLLTSFCRCFLLLYDGSRSMSEDIPDSCQKRLERLECLKRFERYSVLARRRAATGSDRWRCDSCSNDNRWKPLGAESISLKDSIMRNDTQFFHASLGDKHPIERIAVNSREATDRHRMPVLDR